MKNILIIGATSGIGRALAEHFAELNHHVVITGRRENLLQELKEQYPKNITTLQHDVTEIDTTDEKLNSLFKIVGEIDIAIISSGIGDLNPNLNWSIEQHVLNTNVLGITKVYEFIFNKFKKQNKGHIVGISSLAGYRGNRHCPSYSASKAFQINYLESLHCITKQEKLNIKITDIQPGFVDTAMAKGEARLVVPIEKATKQIVRAIQKQKRKAIISKRWKFIGFVYKHLPTIILEKI